MSALVDDNARREIREDLEATLIVEAAAGTGKTTALVGRILSLLASGRARLGTLVAVTFTDKAAAEMKLRLRSEIERARRGAANGSDERKRLDFALTELEATRIGTIHSFCADLLREYPVEAGVDPLFVVAPEPEAEALFEECFDDWFQDQLSKGSQGIARILRRRHKDPDSEGPRGMLRAAGYRLVDQRDFPAPWRRDPFDRKAALDTVVDQLRELGALAELADTHNYLVEHLQSVARFVSELSRREAVQGRDHDGLEAELKNVLRLRSWHWQGSGKYFAREILREDVLNQRDSTRQELEKVLTQCDADLAASLHHDLGPVAEAYERAKALLGRLDFRDLLAKTFELLRTRPAVLAALRESISHVLVDEFQDTDGLQAEILLRLSASGPEGSHMRTQVPGKLFIVGDPKQSIYRFRRADVALYASIRAQLCDAGARVLNLQTSFRSTAPLQAAINAAFAPLMTGQPAQATYVPLAPFRPEVPTQPSLVALPVPSPYSDWGKITGYRIDESYPDAVGAFVEWLVRHSGWTIRGDEGDEPIRTRHICLLFKRLVSFRNDVTRPYVRALEARKLPHVLVGGKSFHEREEISQLRSVLTAIEWPDDDLSVYAALRGVFFALGDDLLLVYKGAFGLHPLAPTPRETVPAELLQVWDALAVLRQLHHGRNRRPIESTLRAFLEATRAHAGVAIWPSGEQALANVLRLLDMARRFESRGASSFRAFVRHLDREADRGGTAEAPAVEEGTDGVRIMTVHRAKGLEFPVVILVDPTAPQHHKEPSRYVDTDARLLATPLAGCTPYELLDHKEQMLAEDAHEAVRLLYVAATRARDLLVVPVVGDERVSGWVDPLHPVVYPNPRSNRAAAPHGKCPSFGKDSVAQRPSKSNHSPSACVMPGEHIPEQGTHRVVWWDPNVLNLQTDDDVGVRQQRILSADKEGGAAQESEASYLQWTQERAALRERGQVPSRIVRTVTGDKAAAGGATTGDASNPDFEFRIEQGPARGQPRPSGRRMGTLVHAVLATLALDKADEAPGQAQVHGRHLGATQDEIHAAAEVARRTLAHPLFDAARASKDVRREVAVSHLDDSGVYTEGVVDLAFAEDEGFTVVDFKTDLSLGDREQLYRAQLRAYGRSIALATGKPVKTVLLLV